MLLSNEGNSQDNRSCFDVNVSNVEQTKKRSAVCKKSVLAK